MGSAALASASSFKVDARVQPDVDATRHDPRRYMGRLHPTIRKRHRPGFYGLERELACVHVPPESAPNQ